MHGNINNTWPGEWLVTSLKKSETQQLHKLLGIEDEAKWLAKLLDLKYLSCCMKRYTTQYPVISIVDMTTCVSQFNHPVIIIGCKKGIDTNLTCDIDICYMNIIEVNANECIQIYKSQPFSSLLFMNKRHGILYSSSRTQTQVTLTDTKPLRNQSKWIVTICVFHLSHHYQRKIVPSLCSVTGA